MSTDPTSARIEVRDLSFSYGKRQILSDLSLNVHAGEIVAITGQSGVGKTTLLNCVLGLVVPRRGTVTICGELMSQRSAEERARIRRDHIGVVFQRGGLIDEMTAEENVALPSLINRVGGREVMARARTIVEELGVAPKQMVGSLSGGEYQRVSLARALIGDPEVVVADEPTASLHPELRREVFEIFQTVTRERGVATLIVTHDEAARDFANRLYALYGTRRGNQLAN